MVISMKKLWNTQLQLIEHNSGSILYRRTDKLNLSNVQAGLFDPQAGSELQTELAHWIGRVFDVNRTVSKLHRQLAVTLLTTERPAWVDTDHSIRRITALSDIVVCRCATSATVVPYILVSVTLRYHATNSGRTVFITKTCCCIEDCVEQFFIVRCYISTAVYRKLQEGSTRNVRSCLKVSVNPLHA